MKKTILSLLAAVLLAGCTKEIATIELNNPSEDHRINQMIEVPADKLGLTQQMVGKVALFDAEGQGVPFQVMYYGEETPQSIVFQGTVAPNFVARYTLRSGKPAEAKKRVFARYVPERKDDFAWENDLAAYRMYGPALANENPSNGVDLWLKCTEELIVDTFYYREHELHLPYHVNYGKGLDCYKVAHTAGCGGVFPILNGEPQIGNQYDRWSIIDEGPLRVVFALEYDHYPVEGGELSERLVITCDAGSTMNRADVTYTGNLDTKSMLIGAGIILHSKTSNDTIEVGNNIQLSDNAGWIALAENAVADAGDAQGRNYVGVILPHAITHNMSSDMLYIWKDYKMDNTQTYYFGGGWSEWQYTSDQDWFARVAYEANLVNNPTTVQVVTTSK